MLNYCNDSGYEWSVKNLEELLLPVKRFMEKNGIK
jgi:hypothetical protein